MSFREYLTGTVFFALLIWGPIDHSSDYGLLIRLIYLIIIPLVVWYGIKFLWNKYEPEEHTETKLNAILSGFIGILFFVFAFLEFTTDYHLINTEWKRTWDGQEPVGEDVIVSGPDYGNGIMLSVIGILFLWFGVIVPLRKEK